MYYYNATTNSPWWIIIKPLWCHVIAMECLNSFPRRFFQSGGWGEGIVYSILSAFTKHLVTLKFYTSAICFLLSGETIFFLKFKAVSNTPSRFVDFFGIPGRAMNSKRGTLLITDWALKQKVSHNEKSPNNILAVFW